MGKWVAGDSPANSPRDPLITVSCHSPGEVAQAAANQATLAIFAPVFEKKAPPALLPPASKPSAKPAVREFRC